MRLAIADPPYLGRADRWYGSGRGHGKGLGRAVAHEAASDWDDPATHRALVDRLVSNYDGWVIAASVDSLPVYLPACPDEIRRLVWYKDNAPIRVPGCESVGISYRHNRVGSKPTTAAPATHVKSPLVRPR